jgi:uroporphyrinogen-III synthase
MPIVLSTKRLTPTQKKHLFLAQIGLVEYNAIQIKPIELKLNSTFFENGIFTSQNAVRLAKSHHIKVENAFCVGNKTAQSVKDIANKIVAIEENGSALSKLITKHYHDINFYFFASKQRRNELPDTLKTHDVHLQEIYLYESVINPKHFTNHFDAILCFSPLGVKAYYENHEHKPPAICIGTTTAKAAQKHTTTYVSNQTSVESVVVKAIKVLKENN